MRVGDELYFFGVVCWGYNVVMSVKEILENVFWWEDVWMSKSIYGYRNLKLRILIV